MSELRKGDKMVKIEQDMTGKYNIRFVGLGRFGVKRCTLEQVSRCLQHYYGEAGKAPHPDCLLCEAAGDKRKAGE